MQLASNFDLAPSIPNLSQTLTLAFTAMATKPPIAADVKSKKATNKPSAPKKPRSSPTHPTYLEMIGEAIGSLKERTGSSQYAIAKFIEDKHKANLPPNFKKLLLVQLKKLTASGKLSKIKKSFKLAAAKLAPKQKAAAKPKEKALAKPKEKAATKKASAKPKAKAALKVKSPAKPKVKSVKAAAPPKKANTAEAPAKSVNKLSAKKAKK